MSLCSSLYVPWQLLAPCGMNWVTSFRLPELFVESEILLCWSSAECSENMSVGVYMVSPSLPLSSLSSFSLFFPPSFPPSLSPFLPLSFPPFSTPLSISFLPSLPLSLCPTLPFGVHVTYFRLCLEVHLILGSRGQPISSEFKDDVVWITGSRLARATQWSIFSSKPNNQNIFYFI